MVIYNSWLGGQWAWNIGGLCGGAEEVAIHRGITDQVVILSQCRGRGLRRRVIWLMALRQLGQVLLHQGPDRFVCRDTATLGRRAGLLLRPSLIEG
ncbi:MAG: hypothetical protein EB071_12785 [Gammaproteobacteria bacterium]|nr:hypothetical protein [Gammaproteobacteria bacterium]